MLSTVCDVKDLNNAKDENVVRGRVFIKDRKEAIMALTNDKETHQSQDASFWSASEHLARDVLHPSFESAWQKIE